MDEMLCGQWEGKVGVDGIGEKYCPWAVNWEVMWHIDGDSLYYFSSFEKFEILCNKFFK